PPHCSFVPILAISGSGRWIGGHSRSSGTNLSGHARAKAIDQHGCDDDHAHQCLLPIRVDLREHEAVADYLEQHAADDGSEWAAGAAGEIGAADQGGRDDVELVGRRHVGRRGSQPAADEDAPQAGRERADDIDLDLDAHDRDSGQGRRLLIAAERKDVAAKTGMVQHHRHRRREHHEIDERRGQAEHDA
ncbi:hypothetical protein SB7C_12365, partial [Staphylococcus epidermidis]